MNRREVLQRAGELLDREPRMVELPPRGKVIFVGDTHGDLEATQKVAHQYLKKPYRLIFLGDYVDRGRYSEENIIYLLSLKINHPEEVYLLAGNHEGYRIKAFVPANFWDSLSDEAVGQYGRLFEKLPLLATAQNGVLALHGGLPDLSSLDDVQKIAWGDDNWNRITWGDFSEEQRDYLGEWGGRPRYGASYFGRIMERYGKRVLIRSHQPDSPQVMFAKRCITVFTSNAYLATRTIVGVDLEREVRSARDVTIETI